MQTGTDRRIFFFFFFFEIDLFSVILNFTYDVVVVIYIYTVWSSHKSYPTEKTVGGALFFIDGGPLFY